MSRGSNFIGQPVYSQVLRLLDREKLCRLAVRRHMRIGLTATNILPLCKTFWLPMGTGD